MSESRQDIPAKHLGFTTITVLIKRYFAIILSLSFLLGLFVSCTKGGDNGGATTQKSTASATASSAAKTAAGTTTVKLGAASASATVSASKAASAADSGSAGDATTISENTQDTENEDNNGEADAGNNLLGDLELKLEETGAGFDLGGKTITYAYWTYTQLPTDVESASSTTLMVAVYKKIQAAEKKYNFKMEYKYVYPSGTYTKELVNNTLAGVKFADIANSNSVNNFPGWVGSNMVIPLDEYIDYESPIIKANPYVYKGTLWGEKHYGISPYFQIAYPQTMYNADILSREGQTDILDLVEKNQWNWTTFLEIVKNCTKDTNGDGIIDQFGTTSYNIYYYSANILASNGISMIYMDNGEMKHALDSAPAQRALYFMQDLTQLYKVNKFGMGSLAGGFYPATVYTSGNAAICFLGQNLNKFHLDLGMNSKVCPLPMGPDVDTYQNMALVNMWSVPATCDMPSEVAKIMTDVCVVWDENLGPNAQFQEVISKLPYDWEWTNPGRQVSTEREFELSNKMLWPLFQPTFEQGITGVGGPSGLFTTKIYTPVINGTMSVSQAVNSARMEIEAKLEALR